MVPVKTRQVNPKLLVGTWHLVVQFQRDLFHFTQVILQKSEKSACFLPHILTRLKSQHENPFIVCIHSFLLMLLKEDKVIPTKFNSKSLKLIWIFLVWYGTSYYNFKQIHSLIVTSGKYMFLAPHFWPVISEKF